MQQAHRNKTAAGLLASLGEERGAVRGAHISTTTK